MAFSLPASLLSLSILIAATATVVSGGSELSRVKQAYFHFYFHEILQGAPNATTFVVAGLGGSNSSSASTWAFGNIVVFDTALRAGPEPDSKLVGRAQGIAVPASMSDEALLTTLNVVFTEGKHSGSTLALLGRVDGSGNAERPVVGGSGDFLMARGYAISSVVKSISATYTVLEFHIYVTYYDDYYDH